MERAIRVILVLLFPALAAFATYLFLKREFYLPANPSDASRKLVEIEPNKSFKEICAKLHDAAVVRSCWSLGLIARLSKLDTEIRSGEYDLAATMTPREILEKLAKGDVFKRLVLVKEGESIWQIGEKVEKAGLVKAEELNKALVDKQLLAKAGILAPSFEGYLFPDTYNFSRPIKPEQIIWRMLEQGESEDNWSKKFSQQADELQLSRHEILTLASIVEKESGSVDEQPLISSVFHNRLKQGMKLQSDPTVIYGIANFNGDLTREDLLTPSAYNTYTNVGLPPGPIANPGLSAIRAALFPAQSTFLFFVADGKGKHLFANTLQEHNENVRKYQKEPAAARNAAPAQAAAIATPGAAASSSAAIANELFPQ
ncbi:MAG: endolytic transglycosylase MltG [Proteobacteria bacterium]|nr:endolytic transglycosylase MltG [Pseudomonadota bacterium]